MRNNAHHRSCLIFPVSGAVGALFEALAVASGVLFVGMLDGQ